MLVCIPVVVFTWLARTSRTMHVRRGFSMRTVFPLRLARVCSHHADDSTHVRSYVGLKAPGTQVTSSPRGHVVVVEVAVVREGEVVEAAAAGSGELLVVVAGAAAGVELLVAVARRAAGVGSR